MISPDQLNELIRRRRSVFPGAYNDRPIDRAIIEQILENANWAPNHRQTEPWRFKVFVGDARQKLSQYLGDYYLKNTPAEQYAEIKHKKAMENPLKSACVIALCMHRDEEERIPDWEEVAALACAVQNMWLSCAAYGIGCYWSTPKAALEAADFLGLEAGERCLGLFYMGYSDAALPTGKRTPVQDKTAWVAA